MSTQTQEHYERGEAYSSLIGMSIISALLIAALIIPSFFTHCNEMACLGPMATAMIQQWSMIIPATLIVIFLHHQKSRHDKSRPIKLVARVGISLAINILGACSIFFIISLWPLFCIITPIAVLGIWIYLLIK